eukprot:2855772-Pleurochrysis_carterae.AAC.4
MPEKHGCGAVKERNELLHSSRCLALIPQGKYALVRIAQSSVVLCLGRIVQHYSRGSRERCVGEQPAAATALPLP